MGFLFILIGLVSGISTASENSKNTGAISDFLHDDSYKRLEEKYQQWLTEVAYIITKEELRVFLQLRSGSDREAFIRLFWQQRDATPGTDDNEYKIEMERRFLHVSQYFSRGTPKPGWMTDMGRIYMILGEPNSTEDFNSSLELYPAQVWYYYGDQAAGLPNYFNITFYKPYGTGEWKLYDPVADGPAALLVNGEEIGVSNYQRLYQKVKEAAPTLAGPSISMVPSQVAGGHVPSPLNSIIMANIYKCPTKKVNLSYATNFLKYKGFVQSELLTRYIENTHLVSIVRDSRVNLNFVHFTIKPRKISVDYNREKDRYFFNFKFSVSLKRDGRFIHQYSKNFDCYLEKKDLDVLKAGGVAIEDFFPVAPGACELMVFVQNEVGREFTFFNEVLQIPESGAGPYLGTPVLGYRKENQDRASFTAYSAESTRLLVDADLVFSREDRPIIWLSAHELNPRFQETAWIEWSIKAVDEKHPYTKDGRIELKDFPALADVNSFYDCPEVFPSSGEYELTVSLFDQPAKPRDVKRILFNVAPMLQLSRPTEMYSRIQGVGPFYCTVGSQYAGLEKFADAESYFEQGIRANPEYLAGVEAFLENELHLKKYAVALQEAERLGGAENAVSSYHRIKGESLSGLGRNQEALKELMDANRLKPGDPDLLNRIGDISLAVGDPKQALSAFEASIQLKNDQPDIQRKIEELKKMK